VGVRMADRPDVAAMKRYLTHWIRLMPTFERDAMRLAALASLDRLAARLSEYEQALRLADDLLRRLSEWDVMNLTPLGGHSDVPFWQAEIARVRAALSGSAGSGPAGG
jgi:hypothetical protein